MGRTRTPDLEVAYFDCHRCEHSIEQLTNREGWYWTPDHGVVYMRREFWEDWKKMPADLREQEFGFPTADEVVIGLSRYTQFKDGRIFRPLASPGQARRIYGPIYQKWLELYTDTTIGIPQSSVECTDVSNLPYEQVCRCMFDIPSNPGSSHSRDAWLQWNPQTGAHYIGDGIADVYNSEDIGHPISDELPTKDWNATYMLFTNNGTISAVFTSALSCPLNCRDGYWVKGTMWEEFERLGGVDGPLARATSARTEQLSQNTGSTSIQWSGIYQDFLGGAIYESQTTKQTFLTRKTGLVRPTSALAWTTDVRSQDNSLSGEIQVIVNDCSRVGARWITAVNADESELAFDYSVACGLKDFDGQIYIFSGTATFPERSRRKVIDEQYDTWYNGRIMNFPALANTENLVCRVAMGTVIEDQINQVVEELRSDGTSLPSVVDLTNRIGNEEDEGLMSREPRCLLPSNDPWQVNY